jgi:hypothetical protein
MPSTPRKTPASLANKREGSDLPGETCLGGKRARATGSSSRIRPDEHDLEGNRCKAIPPHQRGLG